MVFIFISFLFQIVGDSVDILCELLSDKIHKIFNNQIFLIIVNVIISILLEMLNDLFEDNVDEQLKSEINYWSYSDIKFYSILHKSIFKFISQGIIPFGTYLMYEKLINKNNNDDYSNLASKMFVFIEMDGFGYPIIDIIYSSFKNVKNMKEKEENEINTNNIKKDISIKLENKEGLTTYELDKANKKESFKLEENYANILVTYWITMFYLPIYPIGIIQSFLNLLFKFITEKNFLSNIYKRPKYINPHFGFLCLNYFNFGFFLFLWDNYFFFINEDNKSSFGFLYKIFTLLFLIPYYYIAKLLTYCCCKEKIAVEFNFNEDITILSANINKKFKEILNEYEEKLYLSHGDIIYKLNNSNGTTIQPEKSISSYMDEKMFRIKVFVELKIKAINA